MAQDWLYLEDSDVATIKSAESLFSNIVSVVLSAVGIVTFVMILVGGFKYLTSGGDAKATESAKNTITYGIIGLALTIGAWFILLAIQGFTGVNVTQFQIGPSPTPPTIPPFGNR
jgi:hypothetical protein